MRTRVLRTAAEVMKDDMVALIVSLINLVDKSSCVSLHLKKRMTNITLV